MSETFEQWWAVNHPHDWWASKRGGEPLPTADRLLVAQLARHLWNTRAPSPEGEAMRAVLKEILNEHKNKGICLRPSLHMKAVDALNPERKESK